jgi:hypothetical protein
MSVDTSVLPSVFSFDEDCPDVERIRLPPSDFHQQSLRLWRSLAKMKGAVRATNSRPLVIALELHRDAVDAEDWWNDLADESVEPSSLGCTWRELGYDVADRFLTSALSNCGYTVDEKKSASSNWIGQINGSGLIDDVGAALKFRDYSNVRVAEHAPFFVYKIYQLIE